MLKTTFYNQDYIEKINNTYICVIATYENKMSYPIELFYTLDFPAVFFINSKDESFLSNPIFGFISPNKLSITLDNLSN